jgi:hypothetical protein
VHAYDELQLESHRACTEKHKFTNAVETVKDYELSSKGTK